MRYILELNGVYIKALVNKKRIFALFEEYAKNPNNVVRIWFDGVCIADSTEEE